MISSQVIRSSIEELKAISKVDLSVWDLEGKIVAATFNPMRLSRLWLPDLRARLQTAR